MSSNQYKIGDRVKVTWVNKNYAGRVMDIEHDGTAWIELDDNEGRMDFKQTELEKHVKFELVPVCDNSRHLVCQPYSIENLHRVASNLGLKRCWFHGDHYDLPKSRIEEIKAKCKVVSSREIVEIIRGGSL